MPLDAAATVYTSQICYPASYGRVIWLTVQRSCLAVADSRTCSNAVHHIKGVLLTCRFDSMGPRRRFPAVGVGIGGALRGHD